MLSLTQSRKDGKADEISIADNIAGSINTSGMDLLDGAAVFGTLSHAEGTR